MNRVNWTAVAVFGAVMLLVLLIGVGLLSGWGYGGWGMMGPGMMGRWGFSPFGWIGMSFMWLIPISFIVLTVLGAVWLARAVMVHGINPAIRGQTCPSCGYGVQADWRNCPYCSTPLVK